MSDATFISPLAKPHLSQIERVQADSGGSPVRKIGKDHNYETSHQYCREVVLFLEVLFAMANHTLGHCEESFVEMLSSSQMFHIILSLI